MHSRIRNHMPSADLAPLVAGYQFVEFDAGAPAEILAPVPHYSFIFHFGDAYTGTGAADSGPFPRHVVAALRERPIMVRPLGRTRAFRIAMRAHTVEAVLGREASALRNVAADVGELLGPAGCMLRDAVTAADGEAARIAAFEDWLRERVAGRTTRGMQAVARAIEGLAADGERRVRDMAEELAVGERQLERWFLRCVGLRPKFFQRVLRLHAVLQEVTQGGRADWAALASQFGFADQSHLVRECVALAGMTPAAWRRRGGVLREVFQAPFAPGRRAALPARDVRPAA